MNLLNEIQRLVEHSKNLSHIEVFPHSTQSDWVKDINIALHHAEDEEGRWGLFLAILPLWTTECDSEDAKELFGRDAIWKYNEPLISTGVVQEVSEGWQIGIHCGQFYAFKISGEKKLLEEYNLKLLKTSHVISLQEFNRRQGY